MADRARRGSNRGASHRVALSSLRARHRRPARAAAMHAHTRKGLITMKRRVSPTVVEESPTGQAVMRVDDVLLSRGERGTWLIDLKVRPRPAGTDTSRSRSASIAPSTASPGSSAAATARPEPVRRRGPGCAHLPTAVPAEEARFAPRAERVADKRNTSPSLRGVHEGWIRVTESGHHRGDISNGHIRPDPAGILGTSSSMETASMQLTRDRLLGEAEIDT